MGGLYVAATLQALLRLPLGLRGAGFILGSASDGTESASVLAKLFESYAVSLGQPNNIYKVVEVMLQSVTRGCLV